MSGTSSGVLSAPHLPQMDTADGILDLQSSLVTDVGAVRVLIDAYPKRNVGDRITVRFRRGSDLVSYPYPPVLTRYLYLPDPTTDSQSKRYELLFRPLWALPSDRYEVSYMVTSRTGNASLSGDTPVEVINTPRSPVNQTGQASFFGNYAPGPMEAWVVSASYVLYPGQDLVMGALGDSTHGVRLGIYQVPADGGGGTRFALIECDDGQNWSCNPAQTEAEVSLERGSLVIVKLESDPGTDAEVRLALAL